MVNLVLPPTPVEEHEEHKKAPRQSGQPLSLLIYLGILLALIAGLWYLLSQGFLASYLT